MLYSLFGCRSKKISKLRVTGLCAGNSPVTGRFPAQMASNAKVFPFDDVIMTVTCYHIRHPGGIGQFWGVLYSLCVHTGPMLWRMIPQNENENIQISLACQINNRPDTSKRPHLKLTDPIFSREWYSRSDRQKVLELWRSLLDIVNLMTREPSM